jgi:general secretion pathway protein F
MAYVVRYFDPARSTVEERLEQADSMTALEAQAEARGWVLLGARDAAATKVSVVAGLWVPRAQAFSVPWWCRELRTLLQAGMTVVEALETLQAQAPEGARGDVQSALIKALREGKALSRAMQNAGAFPAVLVASVKASERTSTLVSALDDYLKHDEMMVVLRKQVVSAALYPAVVVCLGLLISLFLLLYVIPRFSGMYVDFQGSLSLATRVLLWVSKAVAAHTVWVIAGVVGLAVGAAWALRSGWALKTLLALVARIEVLQRQWDHFRLAKLYQSLALMFKGGYTLEEAFAVCETLGLGGRMTTGLEQARVALMRGRGVSAALSSAGLTDLVSERLLAAGERTGNFDLVLQTIAHRHAMAFTTFVERATRLVEPLLLLAVAVLVGGIVVMMYMPIFDIANSVR